MLIACIAKTQLLQKGMAVYTQGVDTSLYPLAKYSINVFDLREVGGQNFGIWNNPALHPATADSVRWKYSYTGGLFGIAIDQDGNFYLGASSIYGASHQGAAGWGGIYKVDNDYWSVSLFLNSTSTTSYQNNNIVPNTKWGLGDLCFNYLSQSIYFTNFEDGKIYHADLDGNILNVLDPFSSDHSGNKPAPPNEMVWAVHTITTQNTNQLLFSRIVGDTASYSSDIGYDIGMATSEVWGVVIDESGAFNGAPFKILPYEEGPYPWSIPLCISDITSAENGDIYLAGRSMMTTIGSSAHNAHIIKYEMNNGNWSSSPPISILQGLYGPAPNSAGGIDLGNGLDENGAIHPDKTIWVTTDAMVFSDIYVYGINGIPTSGINTLDESLVTNTWCIDGDGDITSIPKTMLGDVEIYRDGRPINNCTTISSGQFPNIVTPNGDGKNDRLQLGSFSCKEYQLKIYNRWGNLIYEGSEFQINWPSEDIEDGVYYCIYSNESNNHAWYIQVLK